MDNVPENKIKQLEAIAKLSPETLDILAELSQYKNIEARLKANAGMIKMSLAI